MREALRRITIFAGHLGSGKTELAINFALKLAAQDLPTSLVDLDVVNPYFRTRLVRERLEGLGLTVICPRGEWERADLPALPPVIRGVLEDHTRYGVFDVGGDDVGATVLGRFKPQLEQAGYHLWLVVNACRPFTRDEKSILKVLAGIERACRMRVTGLVSNTNLGPATDMDVVLAGHRVVQEAARKLGLPVVLLGVRRELVGAGRRDLPRDVALLPLDLYMQSSRPEAL
ncbi:MAG: hypothetical protein IMW93_05385 [Thermoanaerobacteraceae bacterium]|nr:hypothetical protein [Thermoanaerobacteraceae bacterium]